MAVKLAGGPPFGRQLCHFKDHVGDVFQPLAGAVLDGVHGIEVHEAREQSREIIDERRVSDAQPALKGLFGDAGKEPVQGMIRWGVPHGTNLDLKTVALDLPESSDRAMYLNSDSASRPTSAPF
jgi:hypothetical protein